MVTLVQCHSARPSCTHLLSSPDGPIMEGGARRGDPGHALHSSQGLHSAWRCQAALTTYLVLAESVGFQDLPGCWGIQNVLADWGAGRINGSSAADSGEGVR